MKLVKNSDRVKCTSLRNIEATFRRAEAKATEQSWTHVIIIGQGKHSGTTLRSKMLDSKAIYLCELAAQEIWQGIFER